MQKKVVVLGSNSFSGASFVRFLLDKGCMVIGISRSPEPVDVLLPYKWGAADNFSFFQADINTNFRQIDALLDKEKPSLVFNFAAQSMVAESWENPDHWFQTNIVSTVKLHDCLRHKDYLDRYIHISTPEVYGHCESYIQENHHYNPSTPYAVSRAAADMSLKTYFDTYHFPVVWTRASNVYGPGQQLYRIIPRTVLYMLLGKRLQLHGGGIATRSFIHIDDVSNATWKIALDGQEGHIYHIATHESITIRRLVETIAENMNIDFDRVAEVAPERQGKDTAYLLDSTKVRTELGWQDEISLNAGLDQVIAWVKLEYEVLRHQSLDYIHKP